jgi:diacylglycerol kinase family enzyme
VPETLLEFDPASLWFDFEMGVSWRRRAAAITTVILFIGAVAVVTRFVARNGPELLVLVLGLGLVAAAAWWIITEVGILRYAAIAQLVVGVGVIAFAVIWSVSTAERVILWTTLLVLSMLVPAVLAQYALTRPVPQVRVKADARRPVHPVLLCNPWSGGGKVERFGLVELASELGVETVMLDRGLDLEQLTRDAVARGADCLGMAGGDGSQALVASVAREHGLPYVCIPAGTRNHLALDLGLDREDPRGAMQAFRDAVERRIDVGTVNGRLFVNNVSLGLYATIVQSPEYRDSKVDVSRSMTRELLSRQSEPFDLAYTTPDGTHVEGAFVIMVSNNPYTLGARRDAAQRREMDSGRLGVFAISTRSAAEAARLVSLAAMGMRDISKHWYEFTAEEFEVVSRSGTAYAGVDGEALELETPLMFRIHPQSLRLYVPEGNLQIVERRRARNWGVRDVVSVALGREPRGNVA